jgi:sensor domain CHASE-containing protein
MATTITEIKGTVSTTDENIPKELLKTYTPVSVIYNSIGLMLVMAFAGAVNFITIKSPIEELSNRTLKRVLTTKTGCLVIL